MVRDRKIIDAYDRLSDAMDEGAPPEKVAELTADVKEALEAEETIAEIWGER